MKNNNNSTHLNPRCSTQIKPPDQQPQKQQRRPRQKLKPAITSPILPPQHPQDWDDSFALTFNHKQQHHFYKQFFDKEPKTPAFNYFFAYHRTKYTKPGITDKPIIPLVYHKNVKPHQHPRRSSCGWNRSSVMDSQKNDCKHRSQKFTFDSMQAKSLKYRTRPGSCMSF